jgi:hypothetical protein
MSLLAVAVAAIAAAAAAAESSPASVALPGGGKLVAAVGSSSSFRLGVSFETDPTRPGGATPLPSPSSEATPHAPSTSVSWGGMMGLKTSFGALLVSPSGDWALYDVANKTILRGTAPVLTADNVSTIQLPVTNGTGMHGGAEPCLSNGIFAPNYYWDSEAGFLAFAVSPWDSDPAQPQAKHVHCYPAGFSDSKGRYDDPSRDWVNVAQGIKPQAPAGNLRLQGTCAPMQHGTDLDVGGGSVQSHTYPKGVKVGSGPADCCKACDDAEAKNPNSTKGCTAWVATSDGKPDGSGMNCWPFASVRGTHKRTDRTFGGAVVPPPPPPPGLKGRTGWWAAGRAADWYLSPAKGGYDFTANLYDIIGAPGLPPRYAMAFMATYWGYESMGVVDTNMTAMRDGNYPIDSFIMDYDWFGPGACAPGCSHGGQSSCPLADQGGLFCGDYGYEGSKWAKNTFSVDGRPVTTTSPREVLDHFHKNRNMKWAGIRKPRSYSNVNLSATNGWMLAADTNVGAGKNEAAAYCLLIRFVDTFC